MRPDSFDGGTSKFDSGETTSTLLARSFYSATGQIYAVDASPIVNGVAEGLSTHWLTVDRQGNVRDSYRFGFDADGDVASYSYARFNYEDWGTPKSVVNDGAHQSLYGVDENLLQRWQDGIYDVELQAYKFGDRWMSTSLGRWMSEDPAGLRFGSNPNAALNNSPYNFRDPSGRVAETILWDLPSLGVGIYSFWRNIERGDVEGATLDAIGIVADALAVALPFIPGGAGTAIKAARAANTAADTARALQGVGRGTRTLYHGSQLAQTADFFANGYQTYQAYQDGDFAGAMLGTFGVSIRGIQGLNRHGYEIYFKSNGGLNARLDLGLASLRVRRSVSASPSVVSANAAKMAGVRQAGQVGESAAGIVGRKVGIVGPLSGKMRFPDQYIKDVLIKESKNVARQGWTSQLKDYAAIAQEEGIPFELWVRESTRLSKPLKAARDRGDVVIKFSEGL